MMDPGTFDNGRESVRTARSDVAGPSATLAGTSCRVALYYVSWCRSIVAAAGFRGFPTIFASWNTWHVYKMADFDGGDAEQYSRVLVVVDQFFIAVAN